MLPTPETSPWSSRARFTPVCRAFSRAITAPRSQAGSSGSAAMCVMVEGTPQGRGTEAGSGTRSASAIPPKVRWSTKRSWGPSSWKSNVACRCFSRGASAGSTSSWPLMPRWTMRPWRWPSGAVRTSQRYLPRRSAASMVLSVRRAARSTGPGRCRRATRAPRKAAESMRRPTTWSARPRRTTSTSGSSGIHGSGRARGPGGLGAGTQLGPGALGGLLLGLLLAAPDPLAEGLLADDGPCGEDLLVVGALLGHAVLGHAEAGGGGELLQAGLPVQAGAEAGRGLHQRVEQVVHERAGRLEPGGEVDGADDRLHRVGEDRGLGAAAGALLTPPQHEVVAQPDGPGDVSQGTHVDHRGPQLGQLALGKVGVVGVERVGDDEPEHGVPEELQALVVGQAAVLVRIGPVGQGTQKQRLVDLRADHSEEVVSEVVDGPLRRAVPLRGLGRSHAREGLVSPGARCAPRRRSGDRRRYRRRGTRCAAAWGQSTAGTRSAWSPSSSSSRDANGCWSATSSASGQPRQFLLSSVPLLVKFCRAAHRGSSVSWWWSGSSARCAPHSEHSPGQSSRHTGWNGRAGTTASRSTGSRSSRSPTSTSSSSSSSAEATSWWCCARSA